MKLSKKASKAHENTQCEEPTVSHSRGVFPVWGKEDEVGNSFARFCTMQPCGPPRPAGVCPPDLSSVLRAQAAEAREVAAACLTRARGASPSVHRNLEGNVALRSSAAVFTYCKSRGLFAGISLEGSCLIERKETNRK